MLNVMRENLRHLKWLLVLVALSMLLYLGYYFQGGGRASESWAARVNGQPIRAQDFLAEARREDDRYRRAFGAQYEQLRKQFQIGRQVIQRLVDQRIMLEEARKLGLQGTEEELRQRILTHPAFRDEAGRFIGKERYLSVVRRIWEGGVEDFERRLAEEIAIQKWIELVTEPVAVSDAELERIERSRTEKVSFDYVVFPSSEETYSTSISDREIESFYRAHPDRYLRGEGRRIRYLLVDRQAVASKIAVPDAEVEAYYRANEASMHRPEQRRARHILFRIPPGASEGDRMSIRNLAESVRKRLEAGEDFATLARAMSQDPASAEQGGDLGWFGRGQMVPAFEKAAFETPVGKLAPVVESEFGVHVVQVTGSRPAGVIPLEEVREQIRRQLQVQRSQQAVQAEAERLRQRMGKPSDLDSVAAGEGLEVRERILTRSEGAPDLGPSPEFVETVFRMGPGELSPPLAVARGMAIVHVLEVVPSSLPPLEEVRQRVQADLLNERARQAALAAAQRALARAGDLKQMGKQLGKTVQTARDIAPGQSVGGIGRSAELERALFAPGVGPGSRGAAIVDSGAVAFEVTARTSFDAARFAEKKEDLKKEILEQRKAELLDSILESLRGSSYRIEINQALVEQVTS
jgi:peptidyl-prolyl cis-trans isomerase D